MEVTKVNTLSFYNDQGVLTLSAKQYDTGRIFIFNIINDYELCDLTGYAVSLRILKADKTEFQGSECCSIEGSKVIVDTSVSNGDQILSCPGTNLCELHLTDKDGKSVTTWNFIINVEPRVHNGDGIISENSWDKIDEIEDTIRDFNTKLDEHYFILTSDKDVANGVPSLDENKKIPSDELPVASTTLGGVKSGTDITVDADGNVSVNDDSHAHKLSNISDVTADANEVNVLDGITATTNELNKLHGTTATKDDFDKMHDVTATADEINVLDGITASTTELNYTEGATSNIQDQLDDKAPLSSPELTGTPTAPTAPTGTDTTQIATTAFVQTAVSEGIAASDALRFRGTLGTTGTITTLPTTYKTGWTYRVVTEGTYAGQECEIGDLVIALVDREDADNADSDWCVAQTNIDGAITGIKSGDAYIEISQTGSVVTIIHKDVTRTNTTSTTNLSHGDNFTAVKSVTSDTKGHITGVETETVTLPTYKAGDNVTFTPNENNDKMVISSSHETITTSADTTSTEHPNAGETFTTVDSVTRDDNGHVTKINTKTVTLPNTSIIVDDALSDTSENPVQNKVVNSALENKADNIYYDEDTEEFQLRSGTKVLSTTNIKGGGGGIQLAQPTSVTLINADEAVTIKWTDPADLTLNGVTLAKWAGTLVVRKAGSAPTSKTDGVVVVDSKTRDAYKTTGFNDSGLTNGTKYYYGIFPYTTEKVYTYDYTNSITPTAIYPTAPSNISVGAGNAEITVTFTKPSNATGIRIVYGTKSPTSQTDGTMINTTTSPYTITGLTNDTLYYVRVYSYNAKGRFTASDVVSVTPKALELVAWSTGTDAQISAMLDAYYAGDATLDQIKSVWSVGDTRSITLSAMSATGVDESHSSQTVQLDIIGFNHDDLATSVNGKTKALITVQLKNCLNTKGYMNSSDTNSGGWEGSARRTWCNNVFKEAIPSIIKGLIKNVNKKNYKVYNSTTLTTTSDSCFLLSETEIFGTKAYSAGATEGIQYDYYKTRSNRIKQVNGSNYYWWERSPISTYFGGFCNVTLEGDAGYTYATSECGFAPGFCL